MYTGVASFIAMPVERLFAILKRHFHGSYQVLKDEAKVEKGSQQAFKFGQIAAIKLLDEVIGGVDGKTIHKLFPGRLQ